MRYLECGATLERDGLCEACKERLRQSRAEAGASAARPAPSRRRVAAALVAAAAILGALALLGWADVRRALRGARTCDDLCPGGVLVLSSECTSGLFSSCGESWPDKERIEEDHAQAVAQGCACRIQVKASFCGHCAGGE